jgi:hypothetical protein
VTIFLKNARYIEACLHIHLQFWGRSTQIARASVNGSAWITVEVDRPTGRQEFVVTFLVASNASGKKRNGSLLVKQQQLDSVGKKTKKQRKPREKKAAVRKEAEKQPSDNAGMAETPSEVIHVPGDITTAAHIVQQQSQHEHTATVKATGKGRKKGPVTR